MARKRIKKTVEGAKAIGYCRVSTAGQAEEGVSLDAQEARIKAYCEMRGLDLVEVVVDAGVSSGKHPLEKREGGVRVLEAIQSGNASHIVALKLDRLFRNTVECLTQVQAWQRSGMGLHLIDMGGAAIDTSSAMGKMFLTMAAGFAEMESNIASERTVAALARKSEKRERVGNVEYGYKLSENSVHLVPCGEEQVVIAEMKALKAQGLSLRRIGERLEARGFLARNGGRWHPQTISQVLERVA